MSAMKLTRAGFKRKAEKAFLSRNPSAIIIGWLDARKVQYPTGVIEWRGKFDARASGYQPRVMIATGDDSYVIVR